MENKFDERLKTRIKETLENENFEYDPSHWEALNKKKKNKKNFFFWYAAACVLLLVSIGLGSTYFNPSKITNPNGQEIIISKEEKKKVNDIISDEDDPLITKEDQNKKTDKSSREQVKPIEKQQDKEFIAKNKNSNKEQQKSQISTNEIAKISLFNLKNSNVEPISRNSQKEIEQKLLQKISIDEAIAQLKKEEDLTSEAKKLMTVGVHFSPLLSSSTELNNSEIGIAGGVSLDIPLWNKFALNTGVLYSDQNMALNSNMLENTGVVNYSDNQLNSNTAKIKGIEIPINIRYDFNVADKTFFVTTGFSSTSYYDQIIASEYIINSRSKITSQDNFGNKTIQYKLVPVGKETIEVNSKTEFDFASLINFSFGVEFPLSNNRQSLAIEPYYKYSVSSVTYKNIDFSTMGIFLRYNFSFTKKN